MFKHFWSKFIKQIYVFVIYFSFKWFDFIDEDERYGIMIHTHLCKVMIKSYLQSFTSKIKLFI